MKLWPVRRLKGTIRLPGDKSISHRAALIAGVAEKTSRLTNFSTSRDCESTLTCLEQLGVNVTRSATSITIQPSDHLRAPAGPLNCGNSGSTMRMLAGLVASNCLTCELTGDDSLTSRPMKRIIEPLEMMGATIQSSAGKPPLVIAGTSPLKAITYKLPVASAQVKSCVLFAGLNALGRTTVIEPTTTRDHTERLFNGFGVTVETSELPDQSTSISVDGPARFTGGEMTIPGDISSAAYFVAAATLLPRSELTIADVCLNPTRTEFISLLRSWGGEIESIETRSDRNEPVGSINVSSARSAAENQPRMIDRNAVPALIDELPLLAVVGSQLGGVEIRGAAELRVKETDRIKATVKNLRAMGADVEEFDEGLFVKGPTKLRGALIESYGDHRIAMAFSVAALLADGPSEVAGASCVDISFPEFFDLLRQVVES
ncbi:MAG TPA: 3-phosphoshikimate 1-carboxyvinyltransferase [Pyrinomonadaceae bacterium]|nr:3-phosphoshikimate 1-carboxyvinyltransferase [Pyrinomonadaceae bacterium]